MAALIMTTGAGCSSDETSDNETTGAKDRPRSSDLFARPLIVGASVSADFSAPSPGKIAALRYTKPDQIRIIARPGALGRDTIGSLTKADIADRSVVIGIDLFFWDSVATSAMLATNALEKLLQLTQEAGAFTIIGDVPELIDGQQMSRNQLNRALYDRCRLERRCVVLRLDDLHRQLLREGTLLIGGRPRAFRELVPDGLHVSLLASEFLADEIVRAAASEP